MSSPQQRRVAAVAAAIAVVVFAAAGHWLRTHDQRADASYQPAARRAAFAPGRGPRVLVDAAHHDLHTASGRYAPFARLARADGFVVADSRAPFTDASLAGARVLVVANALGARWPFLRGAAAPAFTAAEIDAVERWVRGGGSLLLVADHDPAASAARALALRFGVSMHGGRTFDPAHADARSGMPSWLEFRRDDGTVQSHPITDGGGAGERVTRVVSFTGQSLSGPPGSTPFLALAPTAHDRTDAGRTESAAGRAQGVALWYGRGRVVVLGEAAMLTAETTGGRDLRYGLTWPGTDDERLAVNVLRWLAGVLH